MHSSEQSSHTEKFYQKKRQFNDDKLHSISTEFSHRSETILYIIVNVKSFHSDLCFVKSLNFELLTKGDFLLYFNPRHFLNFANLYRETRSEADSPC